MRQALPGARCLLAAGLLVPAVLGGGIALASSIQVDRPVLACVDPRAALALTARNAVERHGARWWAIVARRGRCFNIPPGERWEQIHGVGGMLLMRRVPPQPGVPPLYFRAASLFGASETADDAALPRADGSAAPVLQPPGQAARTPVQSGDGTASGILTEPLPAPATALASPSAATPPAAPGSGMLPASQDRGRPPANVLASQAFGSPASLPPTSRRQMPGAAAAGTPASGAAAAVPDEAAPGADTLSPDVSVAAERGYAIGFAIAIVLIVVLLTGFALLLRELLRRPADPENASDREADPIREPRLRPPPPVVPQSIASPPLAARPPPPLARRPAPDPAALLQTAGQPREPARSEPNWQAEDEAVAHLRSLAVLREVGWNATVRSDPDGPYTDVVAWRRGRAMTLRCLPDHVPIDEQAVEEACLTRERERADLGVILSNAVFTPAARQLAAQMGIDLVHEDELRAFAT
jgi:restriction system protein